jgi:Hemerythrin HHE cation binding domain
MKPRSSDLFEAFREDHAVLGRGLHEISEHLRGGDLLAAKVSGERIDRAAGAHIAFEERFFYPALRRLLGDVEVDRLYQEHGKGVSVIKALAESPEDATLSDAERRKMLQDSELMEAHVAECGELFGAIGRIPLEEQEALYRELLALRDKAPRWTEFATKRGGKNHRA